MEIKIMYILEIIFSCTGGGRGVVVVVVVVVVVEGGGVVVVGFLKHRFPSVPKSKSSAYLIKISRLNKSNDKTFFLKYSKINHPPQAQ
jgi:hypothetical protein